MRRDKKTVTRIAFILSGVAALVCLILVLVSGPSNPDIKIHSVKASSKLSKYYSGKNTIDSKKKTAWICTSKDYGKYEWIRFRFTERISLNEIRIINGFSHKHKSRWIGDLYDRYSRVRSVRIRLSDNSSYFWILKDNKRSFQTFTFPRTRKTTSVTLYIHNVYKGTLKKSPAISEIQFL